MELRDHPVFLVPYFGSWWPPVWVGTRDHHHVLHGEVGVLVETILNEEMPKRLFIKIEHDGQLFLGALVVEDDPLCLQVHELLEQHLGETIKEIGDLEIGYLL